MWDLLSDESRSKSHNISILEDAKGEVHVKGATL
jgi:hypothetical protein